LACNGQKVYTGYLEEINKDDVDNVLYAADVQPPSAFDNSDGDYEGITNGDYLDGETQQGSVA
jgi:hypothetical protein